MNPLLFFLQTDTLAATAPAAEPVSNDSFIDLIIKGGPIAIVIMGIIALLSFWALFIFIERLLTIRKAAQLDQSFFNNIKNSVHAGNIESAKSLCQSTDSPVARMIHKGLMRIGKPLRDIDAAIENVGNLEIYKLEKNLSTLASIAGTAPMLGFLGTIAGMMKLFSDIAVQNNLSIGTIASGINIKMVTSAAGLMVSIFTFIGYNYLISLVDKVVFNMEQTSVEFMDLLQEPSK